MGTKGTILLGTIGQGVVTSTDDGQTWNRVTILQGFHHGATVRALVNDHRRPEVVLAGTDRGVYRSTDGGNRWQRLDNELSGSIVWVFTFDPRDPSIVYAGTGTTTPAGLYRSEDSGQTWRQLDVSVAPECKFVGVLRFTGIATDPADGQRMWASIEVDGFRRSTDGGRTWFTPDTEPRNPDGHDVLVAAGTTYALVNDEVWTSFDCGSTWQPIKVLDKLGWRYPHRIFVSPQRPETVYVVVGDSTPGTAGSILRSTDAGRNWEVLNLPVPPNSAIWAIGISPANPDVMFAGSRHGYLYESEDGGDSWTKLEREMGEISSIVVVPSA
jgi:photosystem II stability/assembly factor-like uncharacterized protein